MSENQCFTSGISLTPAQQKLNDLWDEHTRCEFVEKSVDSTIKTMIEGAHLISIPTLKGGKNLDEIKDFYGHSFIPNLPPDTETTLISRTIGTNQIVDELIFKFTHTIVMDWMLPGIQPTGKRVEIPLVAIVGISEDKISHEHIYWDQASVLVQVGLIDAKNLPVSGIESAQRVLALTGL